MTSQSKKADIYTDGACKGNPGPGGWGVHAISPTGEIVERFGGEAQTTNNRMELMAAIQAFSIFPKSTPIIIHIDSQYVCDGITKWIHNWKKRGWRTAEGKPVKNDDLWKALDAARQGMEVEWKWVRGHVGNAGNERADALANEGVPKNADRMPR